MNLTDLQQIILAAYDSFCADNPGRECSFGDLVYKIGRIDGRPTEMPNKILLSDIRMSVRALVQLGIFDRTSWMDEDIIRSADPRDIVLERLNK